MTVSTLTELGQSPRLRKMLGYGIVGVTGVPVDTGVLWLLSQLELHYLVVTTGGYLAAMTWNFTLHRRYVFEEHGPLLADYGRYVLVDVSSFLVRVVFVIILMDVLTGWQPASTAVGVPPVIPASLVGVGVAFLVGFAGTNRYVFQADDGRDQGAPAVRAMNWLVHLVWRGTAKQRLRGTRPYDLAFRVYGRLLENFVSDYELTVGGVDAAFQAATGPELISLYHTAEKERPVLEAFVDDIREGDVVWDVGANLGVYSILAARAGADDVHAIEPYPASAERIPHNAGRSGVPIRVTVHTIALADEMATVPMHVDRFEPGTQTPRVDLEARSSGPSEILVDVMPGDETSWPRPDVLKVDVEGEEFAVLKGLADSLPEVRVVYVETHSGLDTQAVKSRLRAAGFDDIQQLHQYDQERYLRAARSGGELR